MPNDSLIQRLSLCGRSDREDLLRLLKLDPERFQQLPDPEVVSLISRKLRAAAGNSIANIKRGPHEFPYKQIVIDVADKLHPRKTQWTHYKIGDDHSVEEIEDFVYDRVQEMFTKWIAGMKPKQRQELAGRLEDEMRKKGYSEATIKATIAGAVGAGLSGALLTSAVTTILFGTVWTTLFGLSAIQMLLGGVVVGGPVGLVVGAAAFAAHPSYTKTIPAVYRLVQVRKSFEARETL